MAPCAHCDREQQREPERTRENQGEPGRTGEWAVVAGVWCMVYGVWCVVCGVWWGSANTPASIRMGERLND
jgi:hypothetical protein